MTRSSTPQVAPRATILFADDDVDTREMMKVLLKFDGYEVPKYLQRRMVARPSTPRAGGFPI